MQKESLDLEGFVNKSVKEKLEYFFQHMLPVGIANIYEYEKLHSNLQMYEAVINSEDNSNDSDNAGAYNGRGVALSKLGRYEEAIKDFTQAIALKPDYADSYRCKGDILHNLKRYEEAIKEYNKAIKLDPNFQDALDNKKEALQAIARQASDKDFEVLLANTPLPSNVRKVAEQKIARLKGSQGSNDGDRSYTEKYLNYLFRLPWGKFDKASIDIIEANKDTKRKSLWS